MTKFIIKLTIGLLLILIGLLLQHTATAEAPNLTNSERYEVALEEWIEKIRWEESRGNDSVVILDTNNKYSYGCLQFQKSTFDHQANKFDIEGAIMDCNVQKELAKAMIRDNTGAWRNWYTTVKIKGTGYPPDMVDYGFE